jgi:hypothetical protein
MSQLSLYQNNPPLLVAPSEKDNYRPVVHLVESMEKRVLLRIGPHDFEVELNDSDTAYAIWLALPFEAYTNAWGDEIYFEIPVKMKLENGRRILKPGEVAYWPEGQAMCVFFGPTPISKGADAEAIADVTPVGNLIGDPRAFEVVGDCMKVTVKKAGGEML